MTAPAPTVGPTEMPRTPYDVACEQYAQQLVDDIADTLAAADCACPPGDGTCEDWTGSVHRWQSLAAAVVRLVYPSLADTKDRDDELTLIADARRICDMAGRLRLDGDGYRQEDVHAFVASLLRDLRRLYDDAQHVREQYGESCRRAYDERDEAQRGAADAVDAVRRVKRTLRPITSSTDCDGLLAAVHAAKRIVRHVRVGREP